MGGTPRVADSSAAGRAFRDSILPSEQKRLGKPPEQCARGRAGRSRGVNSQASKTANCGSLATRCAPVRIASGVAAGTGAPDGTARTGTARAVVAGSVYRWAAPWHLHSAN